MATFESSRVRCPSQPASTKPAVEWIKRPSLPRLDLPSRRPDEVVGKADPLDRRAEHEFARMEHEHVVLGDRHQLGELLLVLLDVDRPQVVVAEDPEVTVDVQVDR